MVCCGGWVGTLRLILSPGLRPSGTWKSMVRPVEYSTRTYVNDNM